MIYFGNLYSFKDYYLKKLGNNISDSFFFEYHYEAINNVDSIISYLSQISSSKKGIILAYIKEKSDVTALLKLLKGAHISKKKKYLKVIVVNDFFGLQNFTLLKQKGADVIFETKATKGAINYAIMKLMNQFNKVEDKGYFQDISDKPEKQPMFTEHKEIPVPKINTESAYIQISLHKENIKPLKCFLEDIDELSLVLKVPVNSSQGISKTFHEEVECAIDLEYESEQLNTRFPIHIKKMEYLGEHLYLYAKNLEPNENFRKLFEIYGKRQENISKFVYHARA